MWSHLPTTKRLIVLPLLAILMANAVLAGSALAAPNIWIVSANAERDTTLVGESVSVNAYVKNSGEDGGGFQMEIEANGTVVETKRVTVDAKSEKQVSVPITLDEPGTYEIRAVGVSGQSRPASSITATRFRVTETTEREDGRTALLRAGTVESGTNLTATFPDAANGSFALEQVSMTGSGEPFNRSVATYAPTDDAPFPVPNDDGSTVIGAVDMDSVSGVGTTSLRVAIARDAIRESGLQTDEVGVYREHNGSYVPLATEQVATTGDDVVYGAPTDGGNQFVVGSLSPAFEVRSNELSTGTTAEGKRINLTTTVANDGPVAGNYTAEMRVGGTAVDERTVSVPAGESTRVTLQHTVTEQGEYEVALGDRSVGSVVWTGDGASTNQPDSDAGGIDGVIDEAVPSMPSLGDVGTLELGIGAGLVLIGGGLLLIVRH